MRGPEPKGIQEPCLRPSALNHLLNSITVNCSAPVGTTVTVLLLLLLLLSPLGCCYCQCLLLSCAHVDQCLLLSCAHVACIYELHVPRRKNAVSLSSETLFCSTLDMGMLLEA